MANRMKGVAKLLGVELGKEFYIEGVKERFKITDAGVEYYSIDYGTWFSIMPIVLQKLLNGTYVIKDIWTPDGHSYCYLETCAFAKKPKLRKAKPLTVYQKLKFARLGCLRWPSLWHHRNG